MSWLAQWGVFWLAKVLAVLGGWLAILSASYLVAMLLTALVVLPLMLNFLAQADYPDLARMGKDGAIAGAWNSVWAAALFVVGWLVTLPLWLIPGLGLLLPLFWMAWLNRRTFAYDALAAHATAEEWRALRKQQAMPLFMLGLAMAALTHVPFVGLLAPSLAALVYALYSLIGQRFGGDTHPMAAAFVVMLSAAVSHAGLVAVTGWHPPVSAQGWGALLAIALLCTVVAIIFYLMGIALLGATQASLISTVEPVVTLLLAGWVLGEQASFLQWVGGSLILAGVALLAIQLPVKRAVLHCKWYL